jgi:uncharacterized protein (UPF0264 family)
MMTRLLISVRDATEAQSAFAGGADLIDVKEPNRGALGAATRDVWREVLAKINERRPVSCALGELQERDVLERAREATGMSFAKVGLAGLQGNRDWQVQWRCVQHALPQPTALVAVIYADWQDARTPLPCEILDHCAMLGCHWALIDTWQKGAGNLFQRIDDQGLKSIVSRAQSLQMQVVIAGSLTLDDLPHAMSFNPDYVGIRSAACVGGREGRISDTLVSQLSSGVRDFPSTKLNCPKEASQSLDIRRAQFDTRVVTSK